MFSADDTGDFIAAVLTRVYFDITFRFVTTIADVTEPRALV